MWLDLTRDPDMARGGLTLIAVGETTDTLIYGVREGENAVIYTSMDKGVTWQKQTGAQRGQLLSYPSDIIDLMLGQGMDIERLGTVEVNGRPATAYTGKVDGKMLQEIFNSISVMEGMSEALDADLSADALSNLGDMDVTFMIDEENGLPVRYEADMAAAMKDLITAVMAESLAGQETGGVEVEMDVSSALLTVTLSNFDTVDPIVIPEAALNAPES